MFSPTNPADSIQEPTNSYFKIYEENSPESKKANKPTLGKASAKIKHNIIPILSMENSEITKQYAAKTHIGKFPSKPQKVNQDSYCIINNFCKMNSLTFFGVMDGHGTFGQQASDLVKKQLPCNILND